MNTAAAIPIASRIKKLPTIAEATARKPHPSQRDGRGFTERRALSFSVSLSHFLTDTRLTSPSLFAALSLLASSDRFSERLLCTPELSLQLVELVLQHNLGSLRRVQIRRQLYELRLCPLHLCLQGL